MSQLAVQKGSCVDRTPLTQSLPSLPHSSSTSLLNSHPPLTRSRASSTLISRDYLTLPTLPASMHSCPTQVSPRLSRETLTPRRSTSVSVPTETRRASLSYCRRSDRCVVVASREWHRENQHWLIRAHICIPSVTQHPALLSTACQHARLQRQQAEESIVKAKYDKEYLPITGFPEFTKHAALLAYGKDSAPLKEDRVS